MKEYNLDKTIDATFINQGKKAEFNLWASLAEILCTQEYAGIDCVKAYDWALDLNKTKTLKMDASDFSKLIDFIRQSKILPIVKAELIKTLNEGNK